MCYIVQLTSTLLSKTKEMKQYKKTTIDIEALNYYLILWN